MKPNTLCLIPSASLLLASVAWAHATEEFLLIGSDTVAGDRLGTSVDVDASTIIGGAPGADPSGSDSGAAYVFFYDGTVYAQQAKLVASDGLASDGFGTSVTVFGDTAVVGAPGSDTNGSSSGAAYVFVRSGTTWTQQAKLTPSSAAASDLFGTAVAMQDDTVVVGAPRVFGTGSAFVFVRTGTTWSQESELSASDGTFSNGFGETVALRDDRTVVGASVETGLVALSGAAYVYSRSGTVWTEDEKLEASDGASGDLFGASVAVSEEGIVEIGAPGDDDTGNLAGATYRFIESGGLWSEDMKRVGLTADDGMGSSVAISYNFTITGAPLQDAGASNTGTGVLWFASNPLLAQVFVASLPDIDMQMGGAVACDICWMVAGAVGEATNGFEAGGVFVFETFAGRGILTNGTFVNPIAMTTTAGPNIGKPWTVDFDTSSEPTATITDILIYRQLQSTPVNSQWGEILIKLTGPRLLWSTKVGSGIVTHTNPLPPDPSFIGLQAAAQGMLRSATKILQLTNAELITIGCFGQ